MNISIREYTDKDYNRILELFYQIDNQHYQELPNEFLAPEEIIRGKKYFENFKNSNDSKLFVAENDVTILGLIEIYIKTNNTIVSRPIKVGYVYAIVVDEKYRRLGIGKKLLYQTLNWLKSNEINRMDLRVYDFNKNSLNFFTNCGLKFHSHFLTNEL